MSMSLFINWLCCQVLVVTFVFGWEPVQDQHIEQMNWTVLLYHVGISLFSWLNRWNLLLVKIYKSFQICMRMWMSAFWTSKINCGGFGIWRCRLKIQKLSVFLHRNWNNLPHIVSWIKQHANSVTLSTYNF